MMEKAGPPAVPQARKAARNKLQQSINSRDEPEVNEEEERILRAATIHLVLQHGGLLVATGLREQLGQGTRAWVINVTLRHPTGHEGYIGDLLYDGQEFEFLTPSDVRKERAQQIALDPEGIRLWNEFSRSAPAAYHAPLNWTFSAGD